MSDTETAILFVADIRPHRSLTNRGLAMLLCALAGGGMIMSCVSWYQGAWLVAMFNCFEWSFMAWLFYLHKRAALAREVVVLTQTGLHVTRVAPTGRRIERYLPSAWAQVWVERRPGRVPALYLTSHGRRIELATFLGEQQKLDLARALQDALYRWRNPVFDNPQLREAAP